MVFGLVLCSVSFIISFAFGGLGRANELCARVMIYLFLQVHTTFILYFANFLLIFVCFDDVLVRFTCACANNTFFAGTIYL